MYGVIFLLEMVTIWHLSYGQELSAFTRSNMAPEELNTLEVYSTLTMDQIIMQALGGPDVSAQKIIGPNGMFLAELDMNLTGEQFRAMYQPPEYGDNSLKMPYFEPRKRKRRKAVRRIDLRWPNATVPYKLAPEHFSSKERYMIKVAMREWEKYTCIRFRKARHDDVNLVRFQNGQGCNSQLGMVGGEQILNLDANGCRWKGLYLHEIGHALGLVHEHQLPNRDRYIEILYGNVAPSMRIWFNKYSDREVNQYDVQYEYSSVMHYGITAFSKDGKTRTIRAKDASKEETIGKVWRKELSFSDVKAVNRMYECAVNCESIRCNDGGFVDQNCRCVCPDGTSNCQQAQSGTKKTSNSGFCKNSYNDWNCHVWTTQGECELNSKFMHENCRKSCGQCGKDYYEGEGNHVATWAWQWLGVFANLFPRNWTIDECHDSYPEDKCRSWAENGDCIANEKWMEDNCKKTCGGCGQNSTKGLETNCGNTYTNDTKCEIWARKGECQINQRWMWKNCQRACRMCGKPDIEDEPDPRPRNDDPRTRDEEGSTDCDNLHNSRECMRWASSGECRHNPTWMIHNCRKACRRCNDGSCKNLYDDYKCEWWARDGECMKNPRWMPINCAKACNTCGRRDTTSTNDDRDTSEDRSEDEFINDEEEEEDTDTGECINFHKGSDCDVWARNGHCEINPGYMHENCRRSCGRCSDVREDDGNGNDRERVTEGNVVGRVPDFEDTDREEDTKGKEEDDKVVDKESSPRPVTTTTTTLVPTRSESTTHAVLNGCTDNHTSCPVWAKSGECRTNPGYTLKFCRLSCKNCNDGVCTDRHTLCNAWRHHGQCSKHSSYMLRFCQKSCKVCT